MDVADPVQSEVSYPRSPRPPTRGGENAGPPSRDSCQFTEVEPSSPSRWAVRSLGVGTFARSRSAAPSLRTSTGRPAPGLRCAGHRRRPQPLPARLITTDRSSGQPSAGDPRRRPTPPTVCRLARTPSRRLLVSRTAAEAAEAAEHEAGNPAGGLPPGRTTQPPTASHRTGRAPPALSGQ